MILANIQALRAFAALSVALHHISVYARNADGRVGELLFDERFGAIGVAVFFAISGFLMAKMLEHQEPWRFLAHRVVRIFPPFLAITILYWLTLRVFGLPYEVQFVTFTLAPAGIRAYLLGVEWTLIFELAFYVGLFLLAVAGGARHLTAVAAGWLVVILASSLAGVPDIGRHGLLQPLHSLPFAPVNVAFAGGLLLPWLVRRRWCPPVLALFAPLLAYPTDQMGSGMGRWLCGIAAVLVVGAAVQVRQMDQSGLVGRLVRSLGDWSYVLYLVHVPVLSLVLNALPAGSGEVVSWLVCVPAILAVTALLGPIDLKVYRRLRARIDALSRRSLVAGGLAYLAVFFGFGIVESTKAEWDLRMRERVEATLAKIPAEALGTYRGAQAAIAPAPDSTIRSGLDSVDRFSPSEAIVTAFAVDAAAPGTRLMLAVYCGGRRIVLARPTRLRPDMAGRTGLEAFRKLRIGYRPRIPLAECQGREALAVVAAPDGRLLLLPGPLALPQP